MEKIAQQEANFLLSKLNAILREQLIDTKKISLEHWNGVIAPLLSGLGKEIDGAKITARTFVLHESYFDK